MITRSMKIRRQLRSARTSALSDEQRRAEMREAEQGRTGQDEEDTAQRPAGTTVPPRTAGG